MVRDLFIVIPGIMGSVLRRGNEDLWKPGFGLVTKLLRDRRWVESLALVDDDATDPSPRDGVVPTGLVDSHVIVPGLVGIEGYTELDQALHDAFGIALIEGDPSSPVDRLDGVDPRRGGVPNYFRFAYDWRRDIRASSLRLHDLIDVALANLRRQRSPDAKVVILAHSMGGLVARYYLFGQNLRDDEPFDGWRNVRELFTLGTPYRGALDAFGRLGGGFRVSFVDLSETLASYTSVYQLLPRYPSIVDRRTDVPLGRGWLYPHQITGLDGFSAERARAAYDEFHGEIERGVERAGTGSEVARTVPHVGFGHRTANRAVLTDDGVELEPEQPDYLDDSFRDGDGTVPAISAIPLELEEDRGSLRYTNQTHGSLQTDRRILNQEVQLRLRQSQAGTTPARAGADATQAQSAPAMSIEGPLWMRSSQPSMGAVRLHHVDPPDPVKVTIIELDGDTVVASHERADGEPFPLPTTEGEYRIEARLTRAGLESRAHLAVIAE